MRPTRPLRIVHCLSVLGLGLALVGSLVGCDAVSSETDPGGGDFAFTALINGERYTATDIPGAGINESGTLFVVSGNDAHTLELVMEGSEPGTYPIGDGAGGGLFGIRASSTIYSTELGESAGTIEVTELTSGRMSGTFSFTASYLVGVGAPELGASIDVTEGTFSVARTR